MKLNNRTAARALMMKGIIYAAHRHTAGITRTTVTWVDGSSSVVITDGDKLLLLNHTADGKSRESVDVSKAALGLNGHALQANDTRAFVDRLGMLLLDAELGVTGVMMNKEETRVTVNFADGSSRTVNVGGDSRAAMIMDVVHSLMF